jgi:hypothetical protein
LNKEVRVERLTGVLLFNLPRCTVTGNYRAIRSNFPVIPIQYIDFNKNIFMLGADSGNF